MTHRGGSGDGHECGARYPLIAILGRASGRGGPGDPGASGGASVMAPATPERAGGAATAAAATPARAWGSGAAAPATPARAALPWLVPSRLLHVLGLHCCSVIPCFVEIWTRAFKSTHASKVLDEMPMLVTSTNFGTTKKEDFCTKLALTCWSAPSIPSSNKDPQVKEVKIRTVDNTHNGCGVDGEILHGERKAEWQCSLLPAQGRLLGQDPGSKYLLASVPYEEVDTVRA